MAEIRLYNDDYCEVLFRTDDRAAADQFLRDSGEDSLAMVIDQDPTRPNWRTRWGGRLVNEGSKISAIQIGDLMSHIMIQVHGDADD